MARVEEKAEKTSSKSKVKSKSESKSSNLSKKRKHIVIDSSDEDGQSVESESDGEVEEIEDSVEEDSSEEEEEKGRPQRGHAFPSQSRVVPISAPSLSAAGMLAKFKKSNARGETGLSKRDEAMSLSHCINKIIGGKLDKSGKLSFDCDVVSELSGLALGDFVQYLQFNCVDGIANLNSAIDARERDVDELEFVMEAFSALDVLYNFQFDPMAQIDRSNSARYVYL